MVAQVGFEPPTFRSCVQRGGKDDVIIMGLLCRGWIFRGFEGFCLLVLEDFKSVLFGDKHGKRKGRGELKDSARQKITHTGIMG